MTPSKPGAVRGSANWAARSEGCPSTSPWKRTNWGRIVSTPGVRGIGGAFHPRKNPTPFRKMPGPLDSHGGAAPQNERPRWPRDDAALRVHARRLAPRALHVLDIAARVDVRPPLAVLSVLQFEDPAAEPLAGRSGRGRRRASSPRTRFSAPTSISLVSRSRWLVGSSRTRKFGRIEEHPRHHQPRLLPAGEHPDRLVDVAARELERAQETAQRRPGSRRGNRAASARAPCGRDRGDRAPAGRSSPSAGSARAGPSPHPARARRPPS